MTIPGVTYTEARGDVSPANPNVDLVFAMIGTCANGVNGSIAKYGTAARLYTARGEGPATRIAGHVLKENAGRVECVFYKAPTATAGAFATIDISAVVGTARPAISGTPLNDYTLYVEWIDACTIGVTGGSYKYSIDGGLTFSGTTSLGTASTIVIPQTGGTITLNPPEAGLVALVNDLRTDFIAHFALTSGSVHLAADTTSGVGIGSAATNLATAITLVNTLRAALVLHGANLTAHTIADTNIETGDIVAVATDGQSAVLLANDLKAKYNAHRVLLTGTVHGAADATNVTTATNAAAGTMLAGDIIQVAATGPAYDADGLTAAFAALAESSQDFSIVAMSGVVTPALAAVVSAGLNSLDARGKHCAAVFQIRPQAEGETEEEWMTATETEFASHFDDRVSKLRGHGRCVIDDGNRVRTFDGPFIAPFVARVMGAQTISEASNWVDAGALNGVSLVDEDGDLIHHDETELSGSDSAHFVTIRRLPDSTRRNGAYVTEPWVCRPVDGRIDYLQSRRVANRIARIAKGISWGQLGSSQTYIPGSVPNTGTLYAPVLNVIKYKIQGVLNTPAGVANDISNPSDPDLVIVDPNVTIIGEKVRVPIRVRPAFKKYIGFVDITLDIQL